MVRIGVLVSGRGTNLQALIDACARGTIPGSIALVIANIAGAPALERARRHGLDALVISHKDFPDRRSFDQRLAAELDARGVTLVCLAGFMRILSPWFVEHYRDRILNIHPALLPAFAGLHGSGVHEAVLASGARFSGCTVHIVTEEVDGGPILVQRVVPVLDRDTAETLAARVLVEEHEAYVEAVRLVAEGRIELQGRRAVRND